MKKILMVLTVLFFTALFLQTGCSKKDSDTTDGEKTEIEEQAANEDDGYQEIRVARYRASIFKEADLKDWKAALNKGEEVTLLEETEQDVKGKSISVALVRLSDDTEGYIRSDYLALYAVAIMNDKTPAYERNNSTSRVVARLPLGTVAMVLDEKGGWLKVTVGELPDGTSVYNRWIQNGYEKNPELVIDALMIDNAVSILTGKYKGDSEIATQTLRKVAEADSALSSVAASFLDGSDSSAEYEYPDSIENFGKVNAGGGLKIRSDASTDAEELVLVPSGEKLGLIETVGDEVEVAGKTGFWYKVNYKGTVGYAFGAFIDSI
ncbi:MAG: SH3 domain-containing protein [Spirochaetes bacterium]|nr:SH3 domain-containing protein [Spirochaetota bacterium]MBN2770861.1 SH3 domain-containing protein [Spirochaetota bacterium]